MKRKTWLIWPVALSLLVPLHGYWYAASVLHKYVAGCGTSASLDDAIQANWDLNGFDPQWFQAVNKSPYRPDRPAIWYVVYQVKPEFQAAMQAALQAGAPFCGGNIFVHTRQGWVGMPEHYFNPSGYLDFWAHVFHLYGQATGERSQP